jgi:class 3 adenylate cyclase
MIPETQYARLGGLHLAYQVLGTGPPDILLLDQWFSHQDAQWDVPQLAELRERLASFGRLITFDKRGAGLSDAIPTSALPSLDVLTEVIPAILDAAGSESAALIANLGSGILAIDFAAAHPERVSSLVLVDSFARFLVAPDFPIGAPRALLDETLARVDVSMGRGLMLDLFAPSLANDEGVRRVWSRYERQASSPGTSMAMVRLMYESDVRELLPIIKIPTLVIHRADGRYGPAQGRYLAEHIEGATYVELPGTDNLLWAGDQDAVVGEIQEFLTGSRPALEPHRVLATELFTDIVGSTARAAEIGDERWQALLGEHHRVVRRQLERFGGREIDTAGDGFLATFDGPARAIRCAIAIRDGLSGIGLEVRAGLHTGEIELRGDDIAGLAVHIGARISALAGAGEVLVSSTVKDLVAGSGLTFEDRGSQVLKGVPGEWHVFAVTL